MTRNIRAGAFSGSRYNFANANELQKIDDHMSFLIMNLEIHGLQGPEEIH